MRLRRGPILMIAGGIVVAVSFTVVSYYSMQFVTGIQDENKHTIDPEGSLEIRQHIAAGKGAYVVAFPDFAGRPRLEIRSPTDAIIVEKNINPPIVIETFQTEVNGTYTLTLFNPSSDETLEASVFLGEQESVVGAQTLAFSLVFITGIAIAIAGAAITILDGRRAKKMKQFGDTSDLV